MQCFKDALAYVRWIGGATDSGKTTIAQILAERHGLQRYHYDHSDVRHHTLLAQISPRYAAFMAASLEEQWVRPEPEDLLQRALESFRNRWPLVVEYLLALPAAPPLIAEGFGLTPELLAPILSNQRQAIWLVPTAAFKIASMARRDKPRWRNETSNPERAYQNVLRRDLLLADYIKAAAAAHGFVVQEVDGSRSVMEMADLVERHFGL